VIPLVLVSGSNMESFSTAMQRAEQQLRGLMHFFLYVGKIAAELVSRFQSWSSLHPTLLFLFGSQYVKDWSRCFPQSYAVAASYKAARTYSDGAIRAK